MSGGSSNSTIYIGSLDERVTERVLYDILIQAGRVVDLYIPRDKETDKPKGYAFAEYETEEIADYAVRLFSGLVTLYNRTLKFAISGQDKLSLNNTPGTTPTSNVPHKPRSHPIPINEMERISNRPSSYPVNYSQVPSPPGVSNHSTGHGSQYDGNNFDYSRRVFGATLDSINRSRLRRFDTMAERRLERIDQRLERSLVENSAPNPLLRRNPCCCFDGAVVVFLIPTECKAITLALGFALQKDEFRYVSRQFNRSVDSFC
ncbi:Splicing factor-like protein [Trema orientale]|uniref:Splicing factor-like protein n=1 Tax=Trema orientale TaxID=63057 RepID=A0A2P5EKY0_TREOI|nr:Splicing factor-like protein [Trema orientale]